jgi:iron-sulfur cluster insertion protein
MSEAMFENIGDHNSFVPLTMGVEACERIRELIEDEGNPGLKLRVFVEGGGCSGFKYGFTFEEDEAQDDDTVLIQHGITVIVDPLSLGYLDGAVINYKTDMLTSKFTVDNPRATTTCGCGESFTV